ncbi:MAG: DEAD/DEAH box helicase [Pseudomonadota bacterium]|nr:DEAD/DEAH box helicase [Pseudomonadota bacterium]
MTDFSTLNVLDPILTAIKDAGYTKPTPIQAQAIPQLLAGRDLLGIAQTGTGKTAAFAIPILDFIGRNPRRVKNFRCRTLILTPTRELAAQIHQSFETYGKNSEFFSTVIYGGVSQKPQVKAMALGQDVLIATPGRLLDLMNQKVAYLDELEIFVLDEADRMLDMGFINDVRKIVARLPPQRQTLMFSATMPSDIASLAHKLLTNPVKVSVTPQATTVEKVDQKVVFVDQKNKSKLLKHLMQTQNIKQALIFTRTKHGANKVCQFLEASGIRSSAIHGNKSQAARMKALEGFKLGQVKALVATDIAARGIDIPGLSHVFNFDLPDVPESYVHRIGRTARAGKAGVAIAFCDISERINLRDIEKTIGLKVPIIDHHPFLPPPGQIAPPPVPRGRGGRGRHGGGGGGHRRPQPSGNKNWSQRSNNPSR